MKKPEELFNEIAAGLPDVKISKMFGATCLKATNGKAGVMFWHDDMIFKPGPDTEEEMLAINGATVFTPMENRPMGGWIHIPNTRMDKWAKYAQLSMEYVATLQAKPKLPKARKK